MTRTQYALITLAVILALIAGIAAADPELVLTWLARVTDALFGGVR